MEGSAETGMAEEVDGAWREPVRPARGWERLARSLGGGGEGGECYAPFNFLLGAMTSVEW